MIPISHDPSEPLDPSNGCGQCRRQEPLSFDFAYAYQPIVDVATRTVWAHEALVRGPNGESAWSVLSQVDDSNRYTFDQECRVRAIRGAAELGMREFLSINFLPNAVYQPESCIRSTFDAARTYGFPLERIVFEVAESEQVMDRPHLVNIFEAYRRFGFSTAIDDFGAGYAGLNLLAGFQPDLVKLDMQLIRDIDREPAKQAIVRGLVGICAELGIRMLAEGIETPAERDCLRQLGVTLMQGYLFSKPVFRGLAEIPDSAWG